MASVMVSPSLPNPSHPRTEDVYCPCIRAKPVTAANIAPRIDISLRIRRAIHLKDLVLLKRIIKYNPRDVRNPDRLDNGNTSLHLAAKLGLPEIAVSTNIQTDRLWKPENEG